MTFEFNAAKILYERMRRTSSVDGHRKTSGNDCLRDRAGPRVQIVLLQQREHGGLDGRHRRGEAKDGPLRIPLPRVEGVLEQAVQDAPNAEGRLDDAGGDPPAPQQCSVL